jgi:hypothetical protein
LAERPDGSRVPFIPYPTPFFDALGNVTGAMNFLVDISEQKAASVHYVNKHTARDIEPDR